MCRCTPEIRTPFCGKPDCQWPEPTPQQQKERLAATEYKEAAQQFFEASLEFFSGSDFERAIYAQGCVARWPWLRPNRWMKESDG